MGVRFVIHFLHFAEGGLGEVGGAVPIARELGDGGRVVGVLVGDEDGVDAFGAGSAEGFEAALEFAAANAGVDEEGGAVRFEQRAVAHAARRQDGNAKRDAAFLLGALEARPRATAPK